MPLARWCRESLGKPAVLGNDCDAAALAEAVVAAARLDRHGVRSYAESTCSADAMVEGYLDLYAELTRQDDAA